MKRSTLSCLLLAGLVAASCQPMPLRMPDASERGSTRADAPSHASVAAADHAVGARASTALEIVDADERGVLAFLENRHTGLSQFEQRRLARTVVEEARRHGLDPALVAAVIQVESGGYHMAVSKVGAMGLMQLLPSTAEEVALDLEADWRGPDSLFDPVMNVKLGIAYLERLRARYGSVEMALAAYNWGPARIDRRIRSGMGVPSIYVRQVMRAYTSADARRS